MPKLTIDTKASLYAPIEVEINGKLFRVRKFTRDLLEQVEALDEQAQQGKISAAYERLELLLGKHKLINELEPAQVGEITQFIVMKIMNPEAPEKNAQRPGPKK